MTRFYILRHGETEWNSDGKYCGKSDIPLSHKGHEQAIKAAHALRTETFAAVYCSPLQRSFETASIITHSHFLPVISDQRISEINFGEWEGKTKKQIELNYPEEWSNWLHDPKNERAGKTGETVYEVYKRSHEFFIEKSWTHPNQTVLMVGHSTLNRIYIAGSLHLPLGFYRKFYQDNTGITIMDLADEEVRWIQMNETAHLR